MFSVPPYVLEKSFGIVHWVEPSGLYGRKTGMCFETVASTNSSVPTCRKLVSNAVGRLPTHPREIPASEQRGPNLRARALSHHLRLLPCKHQGPCHNSLPLNSLRIL